ncbi:MAG: nuclear transport factor 2 family protein [Burkholderiaceae bacterium]
MRIANHVVLGVSLWVLAGLAACTMMPAGSASDESAIRQARATQTKALADNDLDRVASFWTSDISIRRALGQPLTGVEAARKVLEPSGSGAPPVIYQRESTAVEVSPNWPLAYEEGRWSGHIGSVTAPVVIAGRYSAQWVKRNGQWYIRSEVYVALTCADAGCKYPAAP